MLDTADVDVYVSKACVDYSHLSFVCRASRATFLPFQPFSARAHSPGRPGPLRRKLNLTRDSVNNGNGSSRFSSFDEPDDIHIAEMGDNNATELRHLQEATENPFHKRNFDEDSKDPVEQLRNQVSSPIRSDGKRLGTSIHVKNIPQRQRSRVPSSPGLQVQLSCYGDSIGGDLKSLKSFLDANVKGNALSCCSATLPCSDYCKYQFSGRL